MTAWADDGAEHAPISAAAGVAFFAELVRLSPRERNRPNVLQRAEVGYCCSLTCFDPGLTPRGFQRLNLRCDGPLSNLAFNCSNLRPSTEESFPVIMRSGGASFKAGRCRFTPG